ncbi:MAG: hypothetical protein RBT49_11160 [Bacteroidales bacterium]|jgi:hypothetical protein|nr:hypothetical protein [Bacteroidales bacterium]
MDQKKLVDAFNEIVRVDNEVHFNTTVYNLEAYKEVFKKVNTRTNPNSLSVNEALVIMLQVVHSFKYEIDMYCDNIDDSDSDYMNKEIEDIINNRITESKKEPYRITPGNLSTLLLMVLYEINGAHYRINDPDYIWEMELDEILELPNWSYELDSAITQYLLLPLYYATHHHLDE